MRRYVFLGSPSGHANTGIWACPNWSGESVTKAEIFHVVVADLWEDMDSSAVETYGKYNVMSGTVDISNHKHCVDALLSCGWEFSAEGHIVDRGEVVAEKGTPTWVYCLVETLWSYGCRDVDTDESGNNIRKLMRAARLQQ